MLAVALVDHLGEFNEVRWELVDGFGEEEQDVVSGGEHHSSRDMVMHGSVGIKGSWLCHCLTSANAMHGPFEDHICPRLSS